jgi:hypothetical protein
MLIFSNKALINLRRMPVSDIDVSALETLSVSIENNIAHIQLSRLEALNRMLPVYAELHKKSSGM